MAIPDDDLSRSLTLAGDDTSGNHRYVSVAGDTYEILLDGTQTNHRYCLIDMLVPPGGGPPPHRHDFEETFILMEGEIVATFRGEKATVKAGETLHIPANAPHFFINSSDKMARMFCICSPSGQEEFFLKVGDLVPTRTSPPPHLTDAEKAERMAKAASLAAEYKTEFVH